MLSLDTYAQTSLRAARTRRDEARKLIAAGGDPSDACKAEKAQRSQQRNATRKPWPMPGCPAPAPLSMWRGNGWPRCMP